MKPMATGAILKSLAIVDTLMQKAGRGLADARFKVAKVARLGSRFTRNQGIKVAKKRVGWPS